MPILARCQGNDRHVQPVAVAATAPKQPRLSGREERSSTAPVLVDRPSSGCPLTTAIQRYVLSLMHVSSKSSAALAKVHILASRSAFPVSTVMVRSTGPVTAIQAWPAASP
jgi:hypothetical protein